MVEYIDLMLGEWLTVEVLVYEDTLALAVAKFLTQEVEVWVLILQRPIYRLFI
jgi:hypothetical protein